MIGYVVFAMGGRTLAGQLGDVREVVRAIGIEPLDGARAPVTGLLTCVASRCRSSTCAPDGRRPAGTGDVLVLQVAEGILGLAVDRVHAVLGPDELVPGRRRPRDRSPAYVLEVRRDARGTPVFVVSLPALAGLVPA